MTTSFAVLSRKPDCLWSGGVEQRRSRRRTVSASASEGGGDKKWVVLFKSALHCFNSQASRPRDKNCDPGPGRGGGGGKGANNNASRVLSQTPPLLISFFFSPFFPIFPVNKFALRNFTLDPSAPLPSPPLFPAIQACVVHKMGGGWGGRRRNPVTNPPSFSLASALVSIKRETWQSVLKKERKERRRTCSNNPSLPLPTPRQSDRRPEVTINVSSFSLVADVSRDCLVFNSGFAGDAGSKAVFKFESGEELERATRVKGEKK